MTEHPHPTPESLAELAETGATHPGDQERVSHLAQCRRCMALYAEFVETQVGRVTGEDAPPPDWLERGQAIATRQGAASKRRRTWIGAAGLAGASALVAIMVLNKPHPMLEHGVVGDPILAQQLREDSQGSLLYGDDFPPQPRGVRGGTGPEEQTEASLERLVEQNRVRPSDPDTAYWLIAGYLATNQLRNADPFLREARERFPKDGRFLNLAAILAYKENRLGDAEMYIRQALAGQRTASLLVNLAILERQGGSESEAKTLLNEALSRFPKAPVAPYARQLAEKVH